MDNNLLRSIRIRFYNNHGIALYIYCIILILFLAWCLIRRPNWKQLVRSFLFVTYSMLLFMLLFLGRSHHRDPFVYVWGDWIPKQNEKGVWEIDCLYNLFAFIPFSFLWTFLREKIGRAVLICGLISLAFESLQAYFSVGAFQISDIVYNALSGGIGTCLYLIFRKKKVYCTLGKDNGENF